MKLVETDNEGRQYSALLGFGSERVVLGIQRQSAIEIFLSENALNVTGHFNQSSSGGSPVLGDSISAKASRF